MRRKSKKSEEETKEVKTGIVYDPIKAKEALKAKKDDKSRRANS